MSAGCEAFPTSLTYSTMEGCSTIMGVTGICKPMLQRAAALTHTTHMKDCRLRTYSSSINCLRKKNVIVQSL
jgi:hypothetical protein